MDEASTHSRAAVMALLADRAGGSTICPSEVAMALVAADADGDWRGAMPIVQAAVDDLVAEGSVRLSWKGRALSSRAGPYRIGRAR